MPHVSHAVQIIGAALGVSGGLGGGSHLSGLLLGDLCSRLAFNVPRELDDLACSLASVECGLAPIIARVSSHQISRRVAIASVPVPAVPVFLLQV